MSIMQHNLSSTEAAESLRAHMASHSWFVGVGVRDLPQRLPPSSALIVYVDQQHSDQERIPDEWMGFHVRVELSGRPLAA